MNERIEKAKRLIQEAEAECLRVYGGRNYEASTALSSLATALITLQQYEDEHGKASVTGVQADKIGEVLARGGKSG